MRRRHLRRATALVAAGVLAISPLTVGSAAAAPSGDTPTFDFQNEGAADGDIDNRSAATQPTAQQRALASQLSPSVRFNKYGTPAELMPKVETRQLTATSDPVAIARGFLMANNAAFGLSTQAINEMDVLVSRPMGEGSYVMLRQRFGSVPSSLDGLAAFGIRNGAVVYLTSTLSPNSQQPEPATLSPGQALAAAATDAGLTANQLDTTRVELGAVPIGG